MLIRTPPQYGAIIDQTHRLSRYRRFFARKEKYVFKVDGYTMKEVKRTLLKILTNVKQKPFIRSTVSRIIIFRYDRIGDMIVSLPFCKAIKNGFPHAEITMIASDVNACISERSTFIDKTIIKPRNVFRWLITLIKLRRLRPDLVFDLNHAVTPHTVVAARLINPAHVASPYKDGRWGVAGTELRLFDLMPPQHPKKYERPIAETYLDIARLLNCPTNSTIPYPLPDSPLRQNLPHRYLVLNQSGSRDSMRISDQDFVTIVDYINKEASEIWVLVPSIESNHNHLTKLLEGASNTLVMEPRACVCDIFPIIQHAELVITPDTSIVHIASAYSIQTIAIYSSDETLFQQWRPVNTAHTSIVRSKQPKGLDGYSISELLSCVSIHLSTIR